ncbi:phosphate ABC transporter substrate-binding protein PstS [Agromyces atrinae]|uniref:Phosphate-binding protein n=1 Tax=Agromyces atrinae TaxID=592376 RepID=A0A4Q2ME96_9MICO|nr:phosphate ABC transporter substrate-binding protein PstS [Agromyces atrinae]MCI2957945.1 phosphate ABC transporter substrate-binding protein PstS [Agromyces atrinae]NYD66751.1 phosphate transport system substrate-binding protein [Agromyces atrinae]RXZ87410.1 phosphate ABC transporter substrate-binding protein PstS [Agromyces atrinae]
MNVTRIGRAAVVAAAAAILLSSCAANEGGGAAPEESASTLTGTLNGAGASSMGSAQEAWIASFQTANPDVTVNYEPSGSGAGREAFIGGGVAFAGSDSLLSDDELAGEFARCAPGTSAIDLPVYISPIAVIFNVEGVDELKLDAATLANIFSGQITTWNDPAIAALNEGVTLPAANITAVHRSDDSGTTKNFADYLNKVAPEAWAEEASDTFPFASGEGAQGTSGVVEAVTNGVNTIGYADASRAGDLGVAQIKVGDEFVAYSAEAAAAVVDASPLVEGREANDIAIKIDRTTTEPGVYPLVLVSYAIACQEYADAADAELVKAYLSSIASDEGQALAAEQAGSAPISSELSLKVLDAIESIK